jgi:1,4-dihydroxy-2-naphthoate octaprenyltransferase
VAAEYSGCDILPSIGLRLTEVIRAGEWWEYKLVPIVSAFYATAVMLHVPVITLWPAALMILLSMVPGAAYVSVINDLTDREEDLAAGKPNRTAGKSRPVIAAIVMVTIAAGLVFAWLWRGDPLLLSLYLCAWLAFSLYSLPPFRFKTRGILGVLCDASGAHLFPTLVATVLTFREADRPVSALWVVSVAVWAFAYGLRGILWHQLTDRDNDQSSGVRTFAQRHSPAVAMRLGTFVAFPLELLALGSLMVQLRSIVPPALLLFYAFLSVRRVRWWQMNVVVVAPKPRFFIVLHEYYDVFYPLALLLTAAMHDWRDLLALAVHYLLFPARLLQTWDDARRLVRA